MKQNDARFLHSAVQESESPLFSNLEALQEAMLREGMDGWLLYDFRGTNDPMHSVLGIGKDSHLTRRLFYWLPAAGKPTLLRHAVDAAGVKELERRHALYGATIVFSHWQELEHALTKFVSGCCRVAMEISPKCAIPYLSCVDAGTVQLVESLGLKVVPSLSLLAQILGRFDRKGLESHLLVARALEEETLRLMVWIHGKLVRDERVWESQASMRLQAALQDRGMFLDAHPTVAVGPNSADPHYDPDEIHSRVIEKNQVLLVDVWCKKNYARARWADICRMAFTGAAPSLKQQKVFATVVRAQQAAIDFLQEKLASGQRVEGRQIDRCARELILQEGFGSHFTHRLGHSIDLNVHGSGTHLDDFETQEMRELVTRSCFSIEPGIYLEGEFGVRLESDGYIDASRKLHITGGRQLQWYCLDPAVALKLPVASSPTQIDL